MFDSHSVSALSHLQVLRMTLSPKKGSHGFSCNLIPRLLVSGNEVNSCAVLTAYTMMLALLPGSPPPLHFSSGCGGDPGIKDMTMCNLYVFAVDCGTFGRSCSHHFASTLERY